MGWLLQQMTLNSYKMSKPRDIGISVDPGQGHRVGDYTVLEEAIKSIPLPKHAEGPHQPHDSKTWCRTEPKTKVGVRVCKAFAAWVDN